LFVEAARRIYLFIAWMEFEIQFADVKPHDCFIMAAMRSRCGHYIFALWFLSIFLLFLA